MDIKEFIKIQCGGCTCRNPGSEVCWFMCGADGNVCRYSCFLENGETTVTITEEGELLCTSKI